MTNLQRLVAGLALAALAGGAAAHTGHATHGFFAGLQHPFGLDHLLAMVAVGAWSAAALSGPRRAAGPLAFLTAMALGALAGAAGPAPGFVEGGIALSVVACGAMLVFVGRLPAVPGLVLVALAGALHGVAHGAQAPLAAGFAPYAAGFLVTTALLHGAGLALGGVRRGALQAAGALLGGAGLVLLAQV